MICNFSNRLKSGFSLFLILLFLILQYIFHFPCLFKKWLGVSCPACGLTRSIESIFNFDFVSCFEFNFLGIPVFVLIFFVSFLLLKDFIYNDNSGMVYIFFVFKKFWWLFLIFLFISFVFNNI